MYSFMRSPRPARPGLKASSSGLPAGGWLRSTRQQLGLTLQILADRLDVSPQAIHQFEKSEAAGTISLRQLENVAKAMGCRVEYAVVASKSRVAVPSAVPRSPEAVTVAKLPPPALEISPPETEHSLLLENQAAGRYD